jgi:LytR cell envelope-related transcriptional attenuator
VLLSRWLRRDRVEGHAYDIPSADNRVVVEVLNGTTRPGLARKGTRQLRGQGLDVVYFGGADTTVDSTRILLRRGPSEAAERVRRALGAGAIAAAPDTLRRVDVTVILGWDFQSGEEGHP